MKTETVLILYDTMLRFVEKKEFPTRKAAMEYAVQMYHDRKAFFFSVVNKKDYSVYGEYGKRAIPVKLKNKV